MYNQMESALRIYSHRMGALSLIPFLIIIVILHATITARAQGWGDPMSRGKVTVTFAGQWTAASVAAAEFTSAVQNDVGAALGVQRAAAWPAAAAAVSADPGPAVVEFVAWSDPGTSVLTLLRDAAWAETRAYYKTAAAADPADPFVTSAVRAEEVAIHFTGTGWKDEKTLTDADLTKEITDAVKAVTDVTGKPEALGATVVGTIVRTEKGVLFTLEVTSAGFQNITTLLSSPTTYDALLKVYKDKTTLDDGALDSVRRVPAPAAQRMYRSQLQMIFSGAWRLVLQANKNGVVSSLRSILSGAVNLDIPQVVMGNLDTTPYPFNLNVSSYFMHLYDFPTSDLRKKVLAANYDSLVAVYNADGGDPIVKPALLYADLVNSQGPEGFSVTPLVSTHNLVISGTQWPTVLSSVPGRTLDEALVKDLVDLLPYTPTNVAVVRRGASGGGKLSARVTVTQWSDIHILPIALNSFFALAPKLPETEGIYDQYATPTTTVRAADPIKVLSSSEEWSMPGDGCTSRCIGVSVMGGCLLLFAIIAIIIFCVWRTFGRYVNPKRLDSDLVRIPAEQNPFVSTVSMRGTSSAVSFSPNVAPSGASGPMYPPSTSEVMPFGPRNPVSSAASPEARMMSFVAQQPNSSVVRQSNIVIPSGSGEKEFEVVVMPRSEYERSRSPSP